MSYTANELAVQERAGERQVAERLAGSIRPEISDAAAEFLAGQPLLVVGAADDAGRMWATVLTGSPGFARAVDGHTVRIDAVPCPGDALSEVLQSRRQVGTIAIEPDARRRIRVNGVSTPTSTGLQISADEVIGNCPKYIQKRSPLFDVFREPQPAVASTGLSAHEVELIARADTFFVATAQPAGRADASHRGGAPGFVDVRGPGRLVWPDYRGNSMYLTLGNLEANPATGLVFTDWDTGTILQVSGDARVDWDPAHAEPYPGAQRLIVLDIESVVEIPQALPMGWTDPEPSKFNPTLATT